MKHFIKELIERIKKEAPPFFKKMQWLGAYLIAAGTSIKVIDIACLQQISTHLIVAGTLIAAFSRLPNHDSSNNINP